MTKEQEYIASLREDNAVLRNRVTDLTRERDEYKIWWERDSTSLGKALNELRFLRAVNEDSRAQIERLKEILTCPQLTPEARADQFKAVLDQAEKGEPVNSLDLIDALWWRVRNQRREIAKLHEKRRSHEPLPCVSPQAPIARLIIYGHMPPDVLIYAPGLPPGRHDVYLNPTAPGIPGNAEKVTDRMQGVDCPDCEDGTPHEHSKRTLE